MGRKKLGVGTEAVGEVPMEEVIETPVEETFIEPVEEVVPVENEETGALMDGFDEQKDALVGKRVGGKSIISSIRSTDGKTKIVDEDAVTFVVNDAFIEEYVN